jgi:uncharacterized membrane protein
MESIVAWMERMFSNWLQPGVEISVAIWILPVLPMLLFRKARGWGVTILMYSSYFNGFTCWWYSFMVCYRACGLVWLIIGLFLMGVGVVPLAVIGVAIRGMWPMFWNLILAIALAYGPRAIAVAVAYRESKRLDRMAEEVVAVE